MRYLQWTTLVAAAVLALGCSAQDPEVLDGDAEPGAESDPDQLDELPDRIDAPGPSGPPEPHDVCPSGDCPPDFEVTRLTAIASVQGSDGEYLTGMHHREQPLPQFVHRFSYDGVDTSGSSSATDLPEPVTQAIQHSATFVYGDEVPDSFDLTVEIPRGLATGWYPPVRQWEPGIPVGAVADSGLNWRLEPTAGDEATPPDADGLWSSTREISEARTVESDGDAEHFAGFEGVGTFEPPLHVSHHGDDFELHNPSDATVPQSFLIKHRDGGQYVLALGPIPAEHTYDFSPAPKESPLPVESQRSAVHSLLAEGLVDAGLSEDEATAYLQGHEDSLLDEPGDRLVYVAPRDWTEQWLSTDVDPAPAELTEVVVGRIELMHPDQEEALVAAVQRARNETTTIPEEFGEPVSEPRLRRGCELVEQTDVRDWCYERADEMAAESRDSISW